MLGRAALVHRWDCPAVAEPVLPEADVVEVDAAAAAVLRRPYDALRRLIGQAAGLLVLAQASQRREIVDLPAVAVTREQWREVTDALADLNAPRGCERQVENLIRAARLVGACLDALEASATKEKVDASLALDRIAAAYRLVQNSSSDKLGMTMVDFRQSCCNCAPLTARGS
ncbi:MAG TPA: hypothetical protein VGG77_14940 [Roseiarcus sp.]|jgi:hypothetical protein